VPAIVAAVAAFYGIRQFRQYETRVAIADKMDEMQAAADRKHPGMPKTDALKKMAAEEATRQLATKSAREHANYAASEILVHLIVIFTPGAADVPPTR